MELEQKEILIQSEKSLYEKTITDLKEKENAQKDKLNSEIIELTSDKNILQDKSHDLEEKLDKKQEEIIEL